MTGPLTTLVVPTLARPSLDVLCEALAHQTVPVDAPLVVVDDRMDGPPVTDRVLAALAGLPHRDVQVLRTGGGGPARARNVGWRSARTPWVSFLDDDVVPPPDWYARLLADLRGAPTGVVGSQGRVHVPLPDDRRATDWERGTKGLETSRWITADMSYRREALAGVGGFDERFPRAFREDADLALRLGAPEGTVVDGARWILHPVRPSDTWASVRQQAGNQDDALMRALHGPGWERRAHAPRGRRRRHIAVTTAGLVGLGGLLSGRRRVARLGLGAWAAGVAELTWARVAPGPRTATEVRRMLLTSAVIPAAATWHALVGAVRHVGGAPPWRGLPELVLVDRDGTLVLDVPYNGDPALVQPVDGAREALDHLRAAGVRLAGVTNQSAVARGLITRADVDTVNGRVEELVGPLEAWFVCPHGPGEGCACRKPAPGLIKQAGAELGVPAARTVLIGDIGSDVEAAEAAGARAILVPTPATRPEEVAAAAHVEPTLGAAVTAVMEGRW